MPSSEPSPQVGSGLLATRGQFFAFIGGYFALQVLIRTLTSPSVDLDESEQVMFAQRLSWGYGPDPPLYTWLQVAFFSLFGQGVFALALLKNLLLFTTYALTYSNARFITGRHDCGVAAAMSILYIPTIAWESQRDLTHTVLASTMAVATLACFLQLQERSRIKWYLLFGLAAGVGLLAKFNFGLWLLGLLGAGLFDVRLRKAVLDGRMLLALVLCALMVLPYCVWILEQRELAFANAGKLGMGEQSWLRTFVVSLRNVLSPLGTILGPLGLVYGILFARSGAREPLDQRSVIYGKLIIRAVVLILAVLLVLMLVFKATGFRERWFQCFLVCGPVAVIALLSNRLDNARLNVLTGLGATVMIVVACVVPGRIVFGEPLGRDEPLMRPYREVGEQIRAVIPLHAPVVTDTALTGGNMKLALPRNEVLVPALVQSFKPQGRSWALVWDARKSTVIPSQLRTWAESAFPGVLQKATPRFFTAVYYHHQSKPLRLGLVMLE